MLSAPVLASAAPRSRRSSADAPLQAPAETLLKGSILQLDGRVQLRSAHFSFVRAHSSHGEPQKSVELKHEEETWRR